jgi:hypothetical protein
MLEASDGITGNTHAATHKRGRPKAADLEYAPCGECVLNAASGGAGQSGIEVVPERLGMAIAASALLSPNGGSL